MEQRRSAREGLQCGRAGKSASWKVHGNWGEACLCAGNALGMRKGLEVQRGQEERRN